MAETTSTSTLIGSAFANEAFNDGSFRLLTFKKGDPYFTNIVSEIRNNKPEPASDMAGSTKKLSEYLDEFRGRFLPPFRAAF